MKFLCLAAVLTVPVFTLPTQYTPLLHQANLVPILPLPPSFPPLPGVKPVYASPPLNRRKRQDIPDIPDTYLGAPYGALGVANGVPYGALAITTTGPPFWENQVDNESQEEPNEVQTYSNVGPPFWNIDSQAEIDAVQIYNAFPVQPTTYKEGCQNAAGSIVPCALGETNVVVHIEDLNADVKEGTGVQIVDDRKRRETKPMLL